MLIPTGQHIKTLTAARLAADVCGVPTLVIARTDAHAATLLTSDIDERDRPFLTGTRTPEGFYRVRNGIEPCIARGLAYAPHSDLIWMETSTPDLDVAREFAAEKHGYTATRHQREAGTGYFDLITSAISPHAETVALAGSTETEQFRAA